MHYIARAVLGYTDVYFQDLFDQFAWRDHETKRDEQRNKPRRVKKFPFVHESILTKNPNRIGKPRPSYVEEEDLLFKRFDVLGISRRRSDTKQPTVQHRHPCLLYTLSSVKSENPDALRRKQVAYMAKMTSNMISKNNAREDRDNNDDSHQDDTAQRGHGHFDRTIQNPEAAKTAALAADKDRLQSEEAPPKMVIDPNWLVFPGTLTDASVQEARELSSNAFKDSTTTEFSLRHLMTKKMLVPLLKKMASFEERPSFEYRSSEKGDEEIVMQTVPLLKEEFIQSYTIDPMTGAQKPPGKRLLISTMGLKCFRPAMVLFELLSALEYEFTPEMTTPIDLAIMGCEGVHHTHTSYPNAHKRMRKQVCSTLTTSVIRSLFLNNTCAVWSNFPQKCREMSSDNSLNRDEISKLYKEMDDTEAKYLSEAKKDFRDSVPGYTDNIRAMVKKLTKEEWVEREMEIRRKKLEQEARYRLPTNAPFTHLMKNMARKLGNTEEFYDDYHIRVEFERWMLEENGKKLIKVRPDGTIKKDHTRELYYPGRAEEIIEQFVQMSPAYRETRREFSGVRVTYPDQVYDDFLENEKRLHKEKSINPSRYLLQTYERCQEKLDLFLKNLRLKWQELNNEKAKEPVVDDNEGHSSKRKDPDQDSDAPRDNNNGKRSRVIEEVDSILGGGDSRGAFGLMRTPGRPASSDSHSNSGGEYINPEDAARDRAFHEETAQYKTKAAAAAKRKEKDGGEDEKDKKKSKKDQQPQRTKVDDMLKKKGAVSTKKNKSSTKSTLSKREPKAAFQS